MRTPAVVLALLLLLLNAGAATAAGSGPAKEGEVVRPTVLVFGLGSRCRYCVELKQQIGRVTERTGDTVRFREILVDRERSMVQQYRVLLSPTLVFLDATGAEVFRHQGLLNAEQILERLASLELWPRKG